MRILVYGGLCWGRLFLIWLQREHRGITLATSAPQAGDERPDVPRTNIRGILGLCIRSRGMVVRRYHTVGYLEPLGLDQAMELLICRHKPLEPGPRLRSSSKGYKAAVKGSSLKPSLL